MMPFMLKNVSYETRSTVSRAEGCHVRPCLLMFPWNSVPLLKLMYIFGSLGVGPKHP